MSNLLKDIHISKKQGKWLKRTYTPGGYILAHVGMWLVSLFPVVNLIIFVKLMYGKYEGRHSLKCFSKAFKFFVLGILFAYTVLAAFAILYYSFDWPALNLNPFWVFPDPMLFAFSCIALLALIGVIIRALTSKETRHFNRRIAAVYWALATNSRIRGTAFNEKLKEYLGVDWNFQKREFELHKDANRSFTSRDARDLQSAMFDLLAEKRRNIREHLYQELEFGVYATNNKEEKCLEISVANACLLFQSAQELKQYNDLRFELNQYFHSDSLYFKYNAFGKYYKTQDLLLYFTNLLKEGYVSVGILDSKLFELFTVAQFMRRLKKPNISDKALLHIMQQGKNPWQIEGYESAVYVPALKQIQKRLFSAENDKLNKSLRKILRLDKKMDSKMDVKQDNEASEAELALEELISCSDQCQKGSEYNIVDCDNVLDFQQKMAQKKKQNNDAFTNKIASILSKGKYNYKPPPNKPLKLKRSRPN